MGTSEGLDQLGARILNWIGPPIEEPGKKSLNGGPKGNFTVGMFFNEKRQHMIKGPPENGGITLNSINTKVK